MYKIIFYRLSLSVRLMLHLFISFETKYFFKLRTKLGVNDAIYEKKID